MAKYSYEFKLKIVKAYLNGEGGYGYLSKKYNLPSQRPIEYWVHAYKELGKEGLMRSRQNNNYTFQFKLSVVELYLSSEASYQELTLSQGINNSSLITRWVNDFRCAGPDSLRPKKKGRKKTLDIKEFKEPSKSIEEKSVETSAKHIKELEDELKQAIERYIQYYNKKRIKEKLG